MNRITGSDNDIIGSDDDIIGSDDDIVDMTHYEDDLIIILLLHSIYKEIEAWQATIIQRAYRRYRYHKLFHQSIHKERYLDALWDIVEFSYAPPQDSSLPLLQSGGFQYRWANKRFNLNKYR